jgi:pilus assembly protein CpaC
MDQPGCMGKIGVWGRMYELAKATCGRSTLAAIGLLAVLAGILASPAMADKRQKPLLELGNQDRSAVQLRLTVDKARTVACDREFIEVLVANPAIADVVTISNKQLYVLGKAAGITNISLIGPDKHVLGVVQVEVDHDLHDMAQRLRELVPEGDIRVTSTKGKVLLSGTVRDAVSLSRAMAIAEQFAPGAVTNTLVVRGSQQVLLEVRFIEATRDAERDLGVGWNLSGSKVLAGSGPGTAGATSGLPLVGLVTNNAPFGVGIAQLLNKGTSADIIIQALEKQGVARLLAEPNLVALSGDTASFLAGGEFPFPVQGALNTVTVEFKKFGVSLAFTPTVLGGGLINLKIAPEVSQIDPTSSVAIGGTQVPGLTVRRAETTVELREGQSFAIAGLLQASNTRNENQLPWIGDVPVLGTLFRSAAFQRKETDLVIIVTPHLTKPARPGEKLATPLDNRLASNDRELFLRGQLEVPAAKPEPFVGHILEFGAREPGGSGWEARTTYGTK